MNSLLLKDINKTFGQGSATVTALNHINFKAKAGELTLIIGPSGSGKSTLLTILGGLQTPTQGQVFLQGQSLTELTNKQREKLRLEQIGFVLQAYNLVPYLRVRDQFALVDQLTQHHLAPAAFQQITNKLGISDLLNQFPNELSGGQTQRVALARALYPDPAIILADESTAALDSQRVLVVGQLLQDLAHSENKAIVAVTHDERLKQFADHIYELIDGHLTPVY
ncbi:putative ABC transport system ATP-binding protein [Weissella uvarum]|uniref:ABC transporter ATP-binding protein n=1 Tax=Weissella uvarum TaxID=1479233 RepID=UPI00195FC798|nr:ABC transporter ATP-binding protein [Weissella uvarum]MBM7616747.1 putative ABC transport system ATP-binding protein [Weissella uvarum]MCM0594799.1 ABC transporter ATP-binding protein [Weissella uvarum]